MFVIFDTAEVGDWATCDGKRYEFDIAITYGFMYRIRRHGERKMEKNYRTRLFSSYSSTHIAHIDTDPSAKVEWFSDYAARNYFPLLQERDTNSTRILEIACNRGYLLKAFSQRGFRQLHGIDLSPNDVEAAQALVPSASVSYATAGEYLIQNPTGFDVIVMKAMLEHICKHDVLVLMDQIKEALKPDGLVIVDVPNMDWLFASHERYMDFTHELGFTRESLAQVMRNVFEDVEVRPARAVPGETTKTKVAALLRPGVITLANLLFRIIGEGASDVWWHSRGIIGIGRKRAKTSPL